LSLSGDEEAATNCSTKVTSEVPNISVDLVGRLGSIIREVVSEGRVDFEKLRASFGDVIDGRPERYTFTWAGKRNAFRILQMPTRATLIPARDESANLSTQVITCSSKVTVSKY